MTVSDQVHASQAPSSQTLITAQPLSHRDFGSQLRALLAVIRREWVIFLRYPSWVVGLIIWPVIFPAGYILTGRALAGPDGSGLAVFNQVAGTENFLGYIAVGTTIWMWQNIVLWNVGLTLRNDQLRGTLESNWLSPTWRFSFLLGSSITELFTMFVFLVVSFVEFALVFGVRLHGNPLMVLLVLLAAIPSIYGLGFAFASLVITVKEANAFVYLVRGMVMIFSGITFPVLVLPGWMQAVSRWLPQTTIIHAMRNAMLSGANFQTLLPDLEFLLLSGAVLLLAGFLIFNWMERRARRTGAIGEY
jgi:ABC-2 type transport system permease protein